VARVQAAAAKIGYEADPIARALRGGSTGTVGLIVGSLADFFGQQLVHAVQRDLRALDRHTLVVDADGAPERELMLARRLLDQRVDGLIVVPIGAAQDGWKDIAARVPTVAIGDALAEADTAGAVVFDNDQGVADTLRHLHGLGHRRIGVLSWAVEAAPGRAAERAVGDWASRLGLDCQVVPCAYSLNGVRPLAEDLLSDPDRPTALFCLSDSIAYGVYTACRQLGLRIPEDVAVAGYDDHPVSRLLAPPLTSTSWDTDRVARTAVRLLTTALDDDAEEPIRHVEVAPLLQPRGSTVPAAPGPRPAARPSARRAHR